MELTPFDKESSTWQKLKAHYAARLQVLRLQNDSPMLEGERDRLLGQIQEVKMLLKWDEEPMVIPQWGE